MPLHLQYVSPLFDIFSLCALPEKFTALHKNHHSDVLPNSDILYTENVSCFWSHSLFCLETSTKAVYVRLTVACMVHNCILFQLRPCVKLSSISHAACKFHSLMI